MVVIDATMLMLLMRPNIPVPAGPGGLPVTDAKARIEFLVQTLAKARTKIIIPTPALSEILVRAGAAASQEIIDRIQRFSAFKIEPFDTRCAIEVAAMARDAIASGNKRPDPAATYAKVKYDRQILAIAKVNGAVTIYSDDADIRALAAVAKIEVIGVAELPLPPQDAQMNLWNEPSDKDEEKSETPPG